MRGLAKKLHVSKDFPPVSTEAWDSAIRVDLKGADYNKKLFWSSEEGIIVRPYFRREDIKDLESSARAQSAPSGQLANCPGFTMIGIRGRPRAQARPRSQRGRHNKSFC